MQKRLTAASVEKIKPDPAKRLEIIDMVTPGLRLRVSTSGKKSWSFMYKVAGEAVDGGPGKNRRMTLGSYPLVGLADARQKASEARDLADKGIDPVAEKRVQIEARVSSRVDTLVAQFIEIHAKPNTKNWKSTETLLVTTASSQWAGRTVDSVTRQEIHTYLDQLIERDGTGKAAEVRKHFSIFLNWCVDRGYINASPMAAMKRKDLSYKPRERALDMEEIALVWKASFEVGYPFSNVVRLLILAVSLDVV